MRIEYAETPPRGTPLVLVPPDPGDDDEELPTTDSEPEPVEDRARPGSAAAALPPRRRRSSTPDGDAEIEAPLFSPEWGAAPARRPGEPRPSRRAFWIVGAAALIGTALIVAWLAAFYAS